MAVTTQKIYEHDRVNDTWTDRTQSGLTMNSALSNPVSFAMIGHDDTTIFIDDNASKANAYFHLIVCNGGLGNIQRWAGRLEADFADMVGGGDYHDGTTHRALQVSVSQKSRLLLLSPRSYSSVSKSWVENNQQVRWPTVGKLETWTGTGAGFANLIDTGGTNVWSASLGSQHIIYQTRGIWALNYVGSGAKTFDPVVMIPDLGLLSYHLLIPYNNVHYFIGTDYNVHAYYGGTTLVPIGNPVHRYLQADLNENYKNRSWMVMGPEGKRLWIFIVPNDAEYITKAYYRNMKTGAWGVRDFGSKYATGGLTAVSLVGTQAYTIGDSYKEALDTLSPYDADVSTDTASDVTLRYGDKLIDSSRTLTKDYTAGTWSAGGVDYSKAAEGFTADITTNDILVTFDGSGATNVSYGQHYYTAYDVSTNGFSLRTTTSGSGDEKGLADASDTTPADLSVASNLTISFYSVCADDDPGQTYQQSVQEILTQPRLVLGDHTGLVYEMDETFTSDDGNALDCRHLTPVIDYGLPDKNKRWPYFSVVAEGTDDGAMLLRYRTSDFDTSEVGWTDVTFDLTSNYLEKTVWQNVTSKRMQLSFKDFSGKAFDVREYKIGDPLVEENW